LITVKFENPPGNILSTRVFTPGQGLRVGAYVTGPLGLGEPFIPVRFELYGDKFTDYYADTIATVQGNAWVDWILPNVITPAKVRITAFYPIGSDEIVEIPIGIGQEAPPIIPPGDTSWMWAVGIGVVLILGAFAYSKGSR